MKILIVEDDEAIARLLYLELCDEGYSPQIAGDGRIAADLLEQGENYDLIFLDLMLPEIDGFELLEYIRPMEIPVILLTARDALTDKVRGLRLGADDYIVKPFQIEELFARMDAVLRRRGGSAGELRFADVRVETASRRVFRGDAEVVLTAKEFDLLVALIRNKNIALTRERLYEKVWNEPFMGDTRTLDTHIQRLRKKLDWEERIRTVFRVGYRLEETGE